MSEILFIFIFLINRLVLPSSISEWVFLSFIWCSLSPPTIHTQPYWFLRLRDPSFGHQRSITNDNIKVVLWAWPSKLRSTKQEIMLDFKISMNKHVCLESGELDCEALNLERFWMCWWTCGRLPLQGSRVCHGCGGFNEKRLLCGDSGQAQLCFQPLSRMKDDATQDVFRVPSNWSDIWSFPWTHNCQTH